MITRHAPGRRPILGAAFEKRDVQPYVAAAADAGVDLDALQRLVDALLAAINEHLTSEKFAIQWPDDDVVVRRLR